MKMFLALAMFGVAAAQTTTIPAPPPPQGTPPAGVTPPMPAGTPPVPGTPLAGATAPAQTGECQCLLTTCNTMMANTGMTFAELESELGCNCETCGDITAPAAPGTLPAGATPPPPAGTPPAAGTPPPPQGTPPAAGTPPAQTGECQCLLTTCNNMMAQTGLTFDELESEMGCNCETCGDITAAAPGTLPAGATPPPPQGTPPAGASVPAGTPPLPQGTPIPQDGDCQCLGSTCVLMSDKLGYTYEELENKMGCNCETCVEVTGPVAGTPPAGTPPPPQGTPPAGTPPPPQGTPPVAVTVDSSDFSEGCDWWDCTQ